MIISDKRLRRIIVEEITAAFEGPIDDTEIVVSDDKNCFFGKRSRSVPAGRLRTSRAGSGLALDSVMSAIMDHPDLIGVSASDLNWDIVDEEWEDDMSSVTVFGRGCKDSALASRQVRDRPQDTGEISGDTEEIESDEDAADSLGDDFTVSDDTGASSEESPEPEFTGDRYTITYRAAGTLDLRGIIMGILPNKNVTFNGQEYEVRLARERRGRPGTAYRFRVYEAALLDEDSSEEVTIEGSVSVGLGSIPMSSSLPFEEMEPYASEIESGEERITIGPMRNEEGESGYIILIKQ
mgnify:CR=1 FL=1